MRLTLSRIPKFPETVDSRELSSQVLFATSGTSIAITSKGGVHSEGWNSAAKRTQFQGTVLVPRDCSSSKPRNRLREWSLSSDRVVRLQEEQRNESCCR